MFQSTRPVWGATQLHSSFRSASACFNPRAPCGARHMTIGQRIALIEFQSTRPVWGATPRDEERRRPADVSIHAPRVGRDFRSYYVLLVLPVSIHAPRVGRDDIRRAIANHKDCFNPRAPCGARLCRTAGKEETGCFNPRAPCGARRNDHEFLRDRTGFNPRAPCGARQFMAWHQVRCPCFNPRAPCGARPHR